ncbi:MAG: DUF1822 family protein [Waterburya sp.]
MFNPTHLVLELNTVTLNQAWSQSQNVSNPSRRWQSYLNQVALNTFLPWVQAEEDAFAKAEFNPAIVVNGIVINLKNSKLVLIPSEAEDKSELRVPVEWVDIPERAADYYLAAQINVDAGSLCVWARPVPECPRTRFYRGFVGNNLSSW